MSGFGAVVLLSSLVSAGSQSGSGNASAAAPVFTLPVSGVVLSNEAPAHDALARQLEELHKKLDAQAAKKPWQAEVAPWALLAAIALLYFVTEWLRLRRSDSKAVADLKIEVGKLEADKAKLEAVAGANRAHTAFVEKLLAQRTAPAGGKPPTP